MNKEVNINFYNVLTEFYKFCVTAYIMEVDPILIENSRRIYLRNESENLKEGFKQFSDIAINGNSYDQNVVKYLEEEFYRTINNFIEKAVKME